jgi:hypothetical protein
VFCKAETEEVNREEEFCHACVVAILAQPEVDHKAINEESVRKVMAWDMDGAEDPIEVSSDEEDSDEDENDEEEDGWVEEEDETWVRVSRDGRRCTV